MHRAKAKSAPPRLKSKFVKNRTNAMKEIEAWVRKDNNSFPVPEASRMSGQLSDNVTEERMLKAKLWELSKERYKFLSQNSYEKKVFQDRQQKKASMRRVVSADGRQRHASGEPRPERRSSLGDEAPRPRIRNARLALLERLDPTKGKKSAIKKTPPDDSLNGEGTKSGRKTLSRGNSTMSVTNKNDHLASMSNVKNGQKTHPQKTKAPNTGGNQQEGEKAVPERSPPVRAVSVPSFNKRPIFPDKNPLSHVRPEMLSKSQSNSSIVVSNVVDENDVTAATVSTQQGQGPTSIAMAWQSRSSSDHPLKYGMKIESKTNDPRYSSLESKLSPLVRSKTTGDINSIVKNMESLHVRPRKRPTDSNRSKIEVKAWEFMQEKGFAF